MRLCKARCTPAWRPARPVKGLTNTSRRPQVAVLACVCCVPQELQGTSDRQHTIRTTTPRRHGRRAAAACAGQKVGAARCARAPAYCPGDWGRIPLKRSPAAWCCVAERLPCAALSWTRLQLACCPCPAPDATCMHRCDEGLPLDIAALPSAPIGICGDPDRHL